MSRASGLDAEGIAERHLRGHGLETLTRNYRGRRGEIDLVMRDGDQLIFVEVRRRRDTRYGLAAATVGPAKQRRLAAAAAEYLQRYGERPCRFDVVALDASNPPEWIPDAFRVD